MASSEDMVAGQIQVGETEDGAFPFRVLKFTASIDPANVAADVSAEQEWLFTGLEVGDIPIALELPVAMATLQVVPVGVRTANDLMVKCTNPTASGIDIGSGQSITVTVLRPITRL